MTWAILIALFVAASVFLLYPLWYRTEEPLPVGIEGVVDEETLERLDEKKRLLMNLRLLRTDFAEGKVAEDDFRRMEAEYEQQLAVLIDAIEQAQARHGTPAQVTPRRDLHRMGSIVLLLALVVPTFWLLKIYGEAPAPEPGQMAGGQQAPDVAAMVAKLEKRLRENPDDINGQLMLARSYSALGRQEDALALWKKVLARDPKNQEALGGVTIFLLQAGDQTSLQAALKNVAVLRAAEPNEPAWLWYEGQALARLGRRAEARAAFEKVLAAIPADSENARMVRDAIKQLGS